MSSFDRRAWLRLAGIGALGWLAPSLARAETGVRRKPLVVVVQRGALDGLSWVVPHGDDAYYSARPQLAVPAPGRGADACLPLPGGRFGLHPASQPLLALYLEGRLGFVHAVGTPAATRSHFDAQDVLESGTGGASSRDDGFLNRALRSAALHTAAPQAAGTASSAATGSSAATLGAVAIQSRLPRILRGDASALAFEKLTDMRVRGPAAKLVGKTFEEMYAGAVDEALRSSASGAFDADALLGRVRTRAPSPRDGVVYPKSTLGRRMRQIAQLLQADVGVELAVTESGGWDTHVDQNGRLQRGLTDQAQALRAFLDDLGPLAQEVCLVTVTEFGRTVAQNGSGGTDHGHGSVMMVAGGGVRGGAVHSRWDGLERDVLFEQRDLPITIDQRDVFAHVLRQHWGLGDTSLVLPGFAADPLLALG
ncbi:MAG TPA: DUF1501 domain-containing protein [Polyangiaceae bacterium]|nr:DUF1501 domain-containing protein [Polyangiaceae bacterium]